MTRILPYADYFKFFWLMFILSGFVFLIINPRASQISKINVSLGFNLIIVLLAIGAFLFTFAEKINEKILKQKLLYISLNLFKYSILLLMLISIGNAIFIDDFNKLAYQQLRFNTNLWFYMILHGGIIFVLFVISLQLTNLLNIIDKEYKLSKNIEKQIKEIKLR